MTKKDIKEGDIVLLRDGRTCVVNKYGSNLLLYGVDDIDSHTIYDLFSIDGYNEDLTYKYNDPNYDIMAVQSDYLRFFNFKHLLNILLSQTEDITIIWDWKREEIKEVTMEEVEEKFGCKVKIVKEEN